MLQNVFLIVNLVKRSENPCIEAIIKGILPCLILQKVLLGHSKHLRTAIFILIINWELGVGCRGRGLQREALKYAWKNGGHWQVLHDAKMIVNHDSMHKRSKRLSGDKRKAHITKCTAYYGATAITQFQVESHPSNIIIWSLL